MPKSPSIRNSKRRGEWAELRFMAEAVQRGFNVMRPWGESARYDVLLERNGRYLRVQVKSTKYKIGKAYVCGLRSDNNFKPYRRAEIDFVAAYVIPANVWYILPARKKEFLGGKRCSTHKQRNKMLWPSTRKNLGGAGLQACISAALENGFSH